MDIPLFTGKIEPIEKNLYNFDFTLEKFQYIIKNTSNKDWFEVMYPILPKFEINTKNRVAGFLAQTSHESLEYTVLEENLNYSAQGLVRTWHSRFPNLSYAKLYAHNQQKIANKVYANRMGNGDENSGDGWKYKGRGIMQITGKSNYLLASKELYNDDRLINNPELVSKDKKYCVEIACWFWKRNNLNLLADRQDIVLMTKRINGGLNGLGDRTKKYQLALKIL